MLAALSRNIFHNSHDLIFDIGANIMMVQGFSIGENLNTPSWSISTEFAAYLLFPALLGLAFHRRVSVAGPAAAAALLWLCAIAGVHQRLELTTATPAGNVERCFAEFLLGVISYRATRCEKFAAFIGRDVVASSLLVASGA